MAYTATTYLSPVAFEYPLGNDITLRNQFIRGNLVMNNTSEYSIGGIGSTSFEVTAFSSVGLVTYSSLVGAPLYNGQLVTVYNTSSNTNDGTYTVSALTTSSSTAGTFVAVGTIAGSSQTTQTAEGVGQLQFSNRNTLTQTFTVSAVTATTTQVTYTYTTLVGSQLVPGQSVVIAGCTNAGNNGSFVVVSATPTSITAGAFVVSSTTGVTTDSGTGTGSVKVGIDAIDSTQNPLQVLAWSTYVKGYIYTYNPAKGTIQVYLTGASSGSALSEAALGATIAYDTIQFEAVFPRFI
jgi:hypothetical protein